MQSHLGYTQASQASRMTSVSGQARSPRPDPKFLAHHITSHISDSAMTAARMIAVCR